MTLGRTITVEKRLPRKLTGHGLAVAAVSGLLLVADPGHAAAAGCASEVLTVEQATAAVTFVRAQVREAHFHAPLGTVDRPLSALAQLGKALATPLTASELARRINVALGEAHDGHLRLELAPNVADACPSLPLALDWTDDGLLVRGGSAIPTGARVISIGGRSLDELEALAAATIPHENLYWARSSLARLLVRADVIAALGLAAHDGSVDVLYQTAPGTDAHAQLRPAVATAPGHPWISYEIFAADSTGVLRLERCDPTDEFFYTLAAFFREVKQQGIRKVGIDLRGNPGGDASVAIAVLGSLGLKVDQGFSVDTRVSAQLLHDMPMFDPAALGPVFQSVGLPAPAADAKRYTVPGSMVLGLLSQRLGDHVLEVVSGRTLYVLTDGGTFSSASLFAALVRDNHLGLLVGEPTGNSATFNGSEIERAVPGLPYVLHLSTARLLRPDAAAGPAPTLVPDLRASPTAASLASGHDTAVDLIRRL